MKNRVVGKSNKYHSWISDQGEPQMIVLGKEWYMITR